ncbi:MAG: hypothetical protein ACKVT2_09840, partial [Saprospiraceae bacterium]
MKKSLHFFGGNFNSIQGSPTLGGNLKLPPKVSRLGLLGLLVFTLSTTWANTYTVSNTNDAGAGSLRQAIIDANANPGADVIDFSTSGLLTLASSLPTITGQVDIQGQTATGYVAGAPTFHIHTASGITMLTVSGTTGTIINGIDFSSTGGRTATAISLSNAVDPTVTNCLIKTRELAIQISNGSNPTIQGNDFTNSGFANTSAQLYMNGVTSIATGAVTGNTWGGSTAGT